jgi:hypothetical protein
MKNFCILVKYRLGDHMKHELNRIVEMLNASDVREQDDIVYFKLQDYHGHVHYDNKHNEIELFVYKIFKEDMSKRHIFYETYNIGEFGGNDVINIWRAVKINDIDKVERLSLPGFD